MEKLQNLYEDIVERIKSTDKKRKLFDRDLTEADFATSTEQRKPANHKG